MLHTELRVCCLAELVIIYLKATDRREHLFFQYPSLVYLNYWNHSLLHYYSNPQFAHTQVRYEHYQDT